MKEKHLQAYIEMCLTLSRLSNCPRRKFGTLVVDPVRNVVLSTAYNGGPRGGGELCGGVFCHRDGFKPEDVTLTKNVSHAANRSRVASSSLDIMINGKVCHSISYNPIVEKVIRAMDEDRASKTRSVEVQAEDWIAMMAEKYPGVKSGTHMELGCHHAEGNAICNAAANGTAIAGAWMITNGEPCLMCSKFLHHSGIAKIVVVGGGYAGTNGLAYLKEHGVHCQLLLGPQDPRANTGGSLVREST